MASVELAEVVRRYGAFRAVDEVSVEIRDGELFTILGPSGCGKSTLLRIVAGLDRADSGDIRIGGKLANSAEPAARDVGMVFQNYALYPHLTVRENVAFGLRVRKVPRREADRQVDEIAAILEIADLLDRKPRQLSGGQRQRVALGRALVRRPSVLLMDEPLSNLDTLLREKMRVEIRRLHNRLGLTTIYVTHDQQEALAMSDRVMIMNRGRVEQVGPPLEVLHEPSTEFAARFVGSPPMNLIRMQVHEASETQVTLQAVDGDGAWVQGPASGALACGQQFWVGVRPADLDVSPTAGTRSGLVVPVVMDVAELARDGVLLHCSYAGRNVVATAGAGDPIPALGERTLVSAPWGSLTFYGCDDGRRVRATGVSVRWPEPATAAASTSWAPGDPYGDGGLGGDAR
ncbi:MAG: ABC transporter ATP-binding protein [Actinomycetota bacterium]|nr:ABC transporter ATP-binding protein [Actinomycetota bacterium]